MSRRSIRVAAAFCIRSCSLVRPRWWRLKAATLRGRTRSLIRANKKVRGAAVVGCGVAFSPPRLARCCGRHAAPAIAPPLPSASTAEVAPAPASAGAYVVRALYPTRLRRAWVRVLGRALYPRGCTPQPRASFVAGGAASARQSHRRQRRGCLVAPSSGVRRRWSSRYRPLLAALGSIGRLLLRGALTHYFCKIGAVVCCGLCFCRVHS